MLALPDIAHNALLAARVFGPAATIKLHTLKVWVGKNPHAPPLRLSVRRLPGDLHVRPRSSDIKVALQILGARDYALDWCRPYQTHIRALCARILEEGHVPLIIDAGANIGAGTALLASSFPDCQVFAIEPDPGNFLMLRANTAAYPNVTLFQAALWGTSADMCMEWEPGTGWAQRVEEWSEGKARKLPSTTIPDLLARDARLRPVIVKIDIEGAEVKVLASNNAWVDNVPLLIFEAHDNLHHWLGTWQGSAHAFFSVLTRCKREYLTYGENVYAFKHPQE